MEHNANHHVAEMAMKRAKTQQEKEIIHNFCFNNKYGSFNFLNCDNAKEEYRLNVPRYKTCMGFTKEVEIIDIKGDGNCGYHALVYGLKDNNI